MSVRDLHNTMKYEGFVSANSPATTAATVAVSDRTGFAAIEYVLTKVAHSATVATLVVALQSGTATSGHALATTADVLGTGSVTMTSTTAGTRKVGYIGTDRYTSLRVTGGDATGRYGITVIKGAAIKQPQS